MNPLDFVPTKHEISVLKALHFIKKHRIVLLRSAQANMIPQTLLKELGLATAAKIAHLDSSLTEESALLANILKVTQMFPRECVNLQVNTVSEMGAMMEAVLDPHWKIQVKYW